jgi:CRP-like cAMP-binding protein
MLSVIETPQTIKKFFTEQGQRLVYEKKEILVRVDDPQPWVYFLDEGVVEATYYAGDGFDRILGYFAQNSVFAQNQSFYTVGKGSLKFTAINKSVIYRVHRDLFMKQIESSHAFTKEYLQITMLIRIFTTDLVICLGESRIQTRCIHWLLLMAKYYGDPKGKSIRITIPLTQDAVANSLRISRESVSKSFRSLVRAGHIRIDKKYITIADTENLTSLIEA